MHRLGKFPRLVAACPIWTRERTLKNMKRQMKNTIIGARFLLVLAAFCAAAFAVWLAKNYPQALLAGLLVWALGQGLVLLEARLTRRWKALQRMQNRKL